MHRTLAIDAGTTGVTALVISDRAQVEGRGYREFQQHFPRPGWVEHDAHEIWEVTRRVAREALGDAGVEGADLAGIGITNQRERSSGKTAARRRAATSSVSTSRRSGRRRGWCSTRTSARRRSNGC